MPVRIQRKRTKGWKMPPNCVYVGRPTIWGNPFKVSNGDCDHPDCGPKSHPVLTRQDVVDQYRRYLPGLLRAQQKGLIESLRGKDLCCFCRLDQPCHADVLLEVANKFIYTTDMPLDDKEKLDLRAAFGSNCFDKCLRCKHWRFLHRYDGRQPKSECIECVDCKEWRDA